MAQLPTSPTSETRFSVATLRAVESYRSDLLTDSLILPDPPPGSAPMFRQAAAELQDALAPCGEAFASGSLLAMRSSTHLPKQSEEETLASFRVLVAHLKEIPADLLKAGIRAYVAAPGTRYFPKAPGELMEFISPGLRLRQRGAYRFAKMAETAEENARRQDELNRREPVPVDDIRSWPAHMRETALRVGFITQDEFNAATEGLERPPTATESDQ